MLNAQKIQSQMLSGLTASTLSIRHAWTKWDRNVTNPPLHLNVQIATLPMGTSTFWFLPLQMSQATLMGRNGSNACTFIALFMASTYIRSTNKNILELYVGSPLNSSWITLMLSSIARGNNAYDRVTLGIGSPFFSVTDAKANLVSILRKKFNSWGYHRSLNHNNNPPMFSGFLTVAAEQRTKFGGTCHRKWNDHLFRWFEVGYNNKIYVLDSHAHNAFGPVFGAMLGITAKSDLEEFLVNIKRKVSPSRT